MVSPLLPSVIPETLICSGNTDHWWKSYSASPMFISRKRDTASQLCVLDLWQLHINQNWFHIISYCTSLPLVVALLVPVLLRPLPLCRLLLHFLLLLLHFLLLFCRGPYLFAACCCTSCCCLHFLLLFCCGPYLFAACCCTSCCCFAAGLTSLPLVVALPIAVCTSCCCFAAALTSLPLVVALPVAVLLRSWLPVSQLAPVLDPPSPAETSQLGQP